MHHGKGFLDLCLFYNNKSPKVPRRFLCFVSLSGPMSHCVASSLRTDPGALSSPSSYAGARTSTRFDLPDVCVGGRCSFTGTRAFSRAVIAAPKTKEKKKTSTQTEPSLPNRYWFVCSFANVPQCVFETHMGATTLKSHQRGSIS